jgi:tetratricopeptide (TPR) repeat protein
MVGLVQKNKISMVVAALVVTTVALYLQTVFFPFVYFDDDYYVFQNPVVSSGLSWEGVAWAFTSGHAANWHPLTWLSHMTDVQCFGMAAGGHHAVNVLFHAANSALLFLLLYRMTGSTARSACVALLFAVHPVNAESVAWIAERKNLLSTCLMFATLIAYTRYVARPGLGRYTVVFLGFALGLMAKPMLVTLPFLMLLLDYWPLNRFVGRTPTQALRRLVHLVYEKIPLFVLTAIVSGVTYLVQQRGAAMESMAELSLGARLANAVLSYVDYLGHLAFPVRLAVIYPHAGEDFSLVTALLAFVLLCAISAMALGLVSRAPYLFVGWCWFVGTLVPVIGVVQVGYQAMADRYLYVPAIGIFIAVVWSASAGLSRIHASPRVTRGVAGVLVSLLFIICWRQATFWRGTVPLFERAIAVTDTNAEAHNHLGYYYLTRNQPGKAIPHFEAAQHDRPNLAATYTNWGAALRMTGDAAGAIEKYEEALRLDPVDPVARANLGIALYQLARYGEARQHLEQALRHNPRSATAHAYLGLVLVALGEHREAAIHLREALKLEPDHNLARSALDELQDFP